MKPGSILIATFLVAGCRNESSSQQNEFHQLSTVNETPGTLGQTQRMRRGTCVNKLKYSMALAQLQRGNAHLRNRQYGTAYEEFSKGSHLVEPIYLRIDDLQQVRDDTSLHEMAADLLHEKEIKEAAQEMSDVLSSRLSMMADFQGCK